MTTAKIESILPGTNKIGDRDYTLLLSFSDENGNPAAGAYIYEKKSLYEIGQAVPVTIEPLTPQEKKKLVRKHPELSSCDYKAVPVDAEKYIDPNYITFTKNAYPGDKTARLYSLMIGAAALIAAAAMLMAMRG